MASVSIKSVKVKHLRINLFAAVNNNNNNNNNINDIINNTIQIDMHKEENEIEIEQRELPVIDGEQDDTHDDASDTGGEKKSGYYYKNRERKLEYQKKYNKEQGDKIKNYNKDYYQKRRDEILEKAKTKISCECGCEVQLFNMNSHKKTKKHLRALEFVTASKLRDHM
uniref:Uncharacterized protein n=1 Tax=viral metagenome TaxID=1070528 RepID=A0A6C0EY50_9ZZZZ